VKIWLFIVLISAIGISVHAQNCNLQLSGHVEDTDTREKLGNALVAIVELNRQMITDSAGDFVFDSLCTGNYTIRISHVHCETVQQTVVLNKKRHLDIFLPHSKNTLSEVIVEARKEVANTGFKKELSGKALQETKGLSLSEALSKINGVTMLQTGSTISKPVIHGLHSNRILTINNGVRQEGQQWGNEHAPEIDPFIADKLVVIKGVDELRYGSDAIGGLILVEPKPLRNIPGYSAELNTAYFSNNMQYVVSGVFEQQLRKQPAFRYRLQGTFKKGANATTPDYRLNNTGSEEKNFSLTAGWKKEQFNTELFYSQFTTKVGIFTGAHIGNLTDLQNAIQSTKPDDIFLGQKTYTIQRPYQDVAHHLLKLKANFYKNEHRFNILLAGQFNHRKEFDIVRSSSNTKPQLDLSIYTLSEDVNWEHPKKNNFSGMVGISAMQQDNNYSGRYFIPNYRSYSFGSYVIEKWSRHQWELQAGIRYDNKTITTNRLKFNGDSISHDFNFSTLASSLNAIYKVNDTWKLNTNISLASRAPHVNELLSDGIHHGTATYEKGDINLKPEHSINITAGINFQNTKKNLGFDINLYSNNIRNFIYQQPQPDSPVLTIAGAFPLIEYKQTNAVLNGADIALFLKPVSWLEWNAKASILYARNKKTDDWLILMPANRFSNELTYSFKDGKRFSGSYISGEVINVLQQSRVPDDKNGKQDYKAPPSGYTLVNGNASTTILIAKLPVTIGIGVRNLLNTKYRDYLNSMRYFTDEMGRNISFKLRIPIEHRY
jgi:iron complex outermembrane receptor protein